MKHTYQLLGQLWDGISFQFWYLIPDILVKGVFKLTLIHANYYIIFCFNYFHKASFVLNYKGIAN